MRRISVKRAGASLIPACSIWLTLACTPADKPAEEPSGSETADARGQRIPPQIPEEARALQNPVQAGEEAIAAGRSAFGSMCSPCHGTDGRGTGELAQSLDLELPDFTDPLELSAFTDGDLFYILTYGHGAMPGQVDRLEEGLKWSIIHYVRSLAREP